MRALTGHLTCRDGLGGGLLSHPQAGKQVLGRPRGGSERPQREPDRDDWPERVAPQATHPTELPKAEPGPGGGLLDLILLPYVLWNGP